MKSTMKIIIAFLWCVYAICYNTPVSARSRQTDIKNQPIRIILDTDIGNDVDDALALDMLYKYQDQGVVKILGILTNKDTKYAPEFVDIMNTWYGYPRIPIGKITGGVRLDDYVNYAENVCKLNNEDGTPMFKRSLKSYDKLLPSHILYRKLLAAQPDNSVTVITVGFSTNLARLLETPGDKYSPLTGKELVAKKVRLLSVMGGDFIENPRAEFNIVNDIPSAKKLFSEWPGDVAVSPFAVGKVIKFPASVIQNDFNWGVQHPMVQAYLHYRPMPYDRQTWDLTSVLYAVKGAADFFGVSEPGTITVTDDGHTVFTPSESGKHVILSVDKSQAQRVKQYFIEIITQKPNSVK